MRSCFFIGHREANESLLPRLELVIERLITEENVRYFYVGGYGGFDGVVVLGVLRYIEVRNCQTDPNWKLAQQICKMENALKEVDEDYECKSISKVTPFTYTDSEGNTIVYYCCQTTYVSDESGEYTGLNTDAIGMVIDFAQIKNRQECKVNGYDAFQCEINDRSYLCWTLSPEISCVIAYNADAVAETDIFRMAESVQLPEQ